MARRWCLMKPSPIPSAILAVDRERHRPDHEGTHVALCVLRRINQGEPRAIADAAYRIANGIDKARMGARSLGHAQRYCVPSFSTGEEPMVSFLERNGQTVTDGMRTRIADVPAEVQPESVFEEYSADEIPGLGDKFYPRFSVVCMAQSVMNGSAGLSIWSIRIRMSSRQRSVVISRTFWRARRCGRYTMPPSAVAAQCPDTFRDGGRGLPHGDRSRRAAMDGRGHGCRHRALCRALGWRDREC